MNCYMKILIYKMFLGIWYLLCVLGKICIFDEKINPLWHWWEKQNVLTNCNPSSLNGICYDMTATIHTSAIIAELVSVLSDISFYLLTYTISLDS